jgi:hypothetical protein
MTAENDTRIAENDTRIRRLTACFIVPVDFEDVTAITWLTGPLPLTMPQGGRDVEVTEELRLTYFRSRVLSAIYERRWYTLRDRALSCANLFGVELVALPDDLQLHSGVAIYHLSLAEQDINALARLSRLEGSPTASATRDQLQAELPLGVTIEEGTRRAWTAAHATFADGSPRPLDPQLSWAPTDQWLWMTASMTPLEDYPPSPDDGSLLTSRIPLSRDWSALVLRDGIGFVGTTADDGDPANFHAVAASLVHTVYLDIFLLTRLQLLAMNALADQLAQAGLTPQDRAVLNNLEMRLAYFRKTLWWESVSVYGRANQLLETAQGQLGLSRLMTQIIADLRDIASFVEARAARRTNALLALLTVVGLPFGLTFASAITITTPSPLLFAVSSVIAIGVVLLLLAIIPAARGLLRDLVRRD